MEVYVTGFLRPFYAQRALYETPQQIESVFWKIFVHSTDTLEISYDDSNGSKRDRISVTKVLYKNVFSQADLNAKTSDK